MVRLDSKNKEGITSLTGMTILIVGKSDLKNGLLSYFLQHKGGATCITGSYSSPSTVGPLEERPNCDLLLWDVAGMSDSDIYAYLKRVALGDTPLALFDLDRQVKVESFAITNGAKGFFYLGDPLSTLIRGVAKMVGGELWVPRHVMERCVLEKSTPFQSKNNQTHLTRREVQVLFHLCKGHSNAQIAEALYVSIHTVKTHIYNIYQKIKVSNRMQAARWTAENLTMDPHTQKPFLKHSV